MSKHFYGEGVTPWKLCRDMQTSGVPHVDALRCDIIEYAFRVKGDTAKQIDDLEKVVTCAARAIEVLKEEVAAKNQPELFAAKPPGLDCDRCPSMGPCPQVCIDAHLPEEERHEAPHSDPPWKFESIGGHRYRKTVHPPKCVDCGLEGIENMKATACTATNGGGA